MMTAGAFDAIIIFVLVAAFVLTVLVGLVSWYVDRKHGSD